MLRIWCKDIIHRLIKTLPCTMFEYMYRQDDELIVFIGRNTNNIDCSIGLHQMNISTTTVSTLMLETKIFGSQKAYTNGDN